MRQKQVYLAAAGLSLLFYLIGVLSGLFIEKSSISYTEEQTSSLQRQMENMQLEYAYLSIIGQNISCDSLSLLVSETTSKARTLGQQLEKKGQDDEENRREYAFLSTKAWILNSYMKEKCRNDVVVLLYFYSVPCDECIEQGHILDDLGARYFKDKLIVFVLNSDIDEPIVSTLKKTNKVSKTPAIVIGDQTYEGLVSEDRLKDIISGELGAGNVSA
jgi:thiol-disulfide isomerase/thioredoxin